MPQTKTKKCSIRKSILAAFNRVRHSEERHFQLWHTSSYLSALPFPTTTKHSLRSLNSTALVTRWISYPNCSATRPWRNIPILQTPLSTIPHPKYIWCSLNLATLRVKVLLAPSTKYCAKRSTPRRKIQFTESTQLASVGGISPPPRRRITLLQSELPRGAPLLPF